MLEPKKFHDALVRHGTTFFTGVPDSLLEHFCAYIEEHVPKGKHIIAANEGNAIALAAGHYIATGNPACVYLQNSGLGNTVNPLLSLVDPKVYSIPLLLIIGWRSEPGVADEPQHIKQGTITRELLETLGIEHVVLPLEHATAEEALEKAFVYMKKEKAPYALVVKKGTFDEYPHGKKESEHSLLREEALHILLDALLPDDIVVSTTGKTSREVFEYRTKKGEGHGRDFLTVGSMGHASSIALAIALEKPERRVWCFDGDGAAIMHMGALSIIGAQSPKNFVHVVLNNGAHESVGGQPTSASISDLAKIAEGCRYRHLYVVSSTEEIKACLRTLQLHINDGPVFIEIKLKQGSRKDLGRPTQTPKENKEALMKVLGILVEE